MYRYIDIAIDDWYRYLYRYRYRYINIDINIDTNADTDLHIDIGMFLCISLIQKLGHIAILNCRKNSKSSL